MSWKQSDYSKLSTEELVKMEESAYADYYRLATCPRTNPSQEDLEPLEEATAKWEAICEELRARKQPMNDQTQSATVRADQAVACNGVPIFDGHGGILTTDDAVRLEEMWEKAENYSYNHSSLSNTSPKVSLDQQIKSASTRAAEAQPTSTAKMKAPVPEL